MRAGLALMLLALLTPGCLSLTMGPEEDPRADEWTDKIDPRYPVNIVDKSGSREYGIDLRSLSAARGQLLRFVVVAYGNASVKVDFETQVGSLPEAGGCLAYAAHLGSLGHATGAPADLASVVWLPGTGAQSGAHVAGAGTTVDHGPIGTRSGGRHNDTARFSLAAAQEVIVEFGGSDPKQFTAQASNRFQVNISVTGEAYLLGERSVNLSPRWLECGVGASTFARNPRSEVQAGPAGIIVGLSRSWKITDAASIWMEVPPSAAQRTMTIEWEGRSHTNPRRLVDSTDLPGTIRIALEAWHETEHDAPLWVLVFSRWPAWEAP